jgi:uncharacterized protein YqeY
MDPISRVRQSTIAALKTGDKVRLESLRYLSAQLQNAQINKGRDALLTEEEFLQIVRKIIKNSEEAIEQYRQGGRHDLVEAEEAKTNILREFLPQAMSEAEVRALVQQLHNEKPELAIGPLTGLVMKASAGRAEGRIVSEIIRQELSSS